ncbi:hypothetical protein AB0M12_14310 [Nocardia vinacea]|uniref:hypothetical protein n=1 Tax=Nocardia vinacea TaxID=96468 RepID=UPI00341D4474
MAAEHLERMGLDPATVRRRIDFLEAYAAGAWEEIESFSQPRTPESRNALWTMQADYATALREAGQLSMAFDPAKAAELLARAGQEFVGLGAGFGLFSSLLANSLNDDLREDLNEAVTMLDPAESRGSLAEFESRPRFTAEPQQAAYILLASVFDPETASRRKSSLQRLITASPHRSGVLSVGALGTPIHRYWAIARSALEEKGRLAELIPHVNAMCARYDEAVELARTNTYLWENCSAPIDIVDIDIVGIVALVTRRLGPEQISELFYRPRSQPASTQIEIGIAMGDNRRK